MTPTTPRLVLPLLLVVGMFASGCVPLATTHHDRRVPPPHRAPVPAHPAVYNRIAKDADRYVRTLDRTLRLDRRQEQRIARLLTDRAYDRVRRTRAHDRDRVYPFPRRYADRHTRNWWRDADRQIERELDRRQRAVYRDLVRHYEHRANRDRRHRGHRGRN